MSDALSKASARAQLIIGVLAERGDAAEKLLDLRTGIAEVRDLADTFSAEYAAQSEFAARQAARDFSVVAARLDALLAAAVSRTEPERQET